jgi:DNA-binding NtrC family response regulator
MAKKKTSPISIVYVDDNQQSLTVVAMFLRSLKPELRLFTDPIECLKSLKTTPADIVITDFEMPEMTGLDVLQRVKKLSPKTEVIIATGAADKDVAINALKLGAYDFFEKPVDREDLLASIKRTIQYHTACKERDTYEEQLSDMSEKEALKWGLKAFVGKSDSLKQVLADIKALQKNDRTSVLVTGESGTGKELVARAIHSGSNRSSRPFVSVNCSAIPDNLAESILFGHTKGSFTGATADKKGSFELANGGTLFLDEIGDMLPSIQAKLLRVLEDKVVEAVGSTKGKSVDVRIIAATNADLDNKVAEKAFRADLFHRLASFRISLPPLKNRKGDIPLLAQHFTNSLSAEMGLPDQTLSPDALKALEAYDYPGNVRELKNAIEQALIRATDGIICPEQIRFSCTTRNTPSPASSTNAAHTATAETDTTELPLNLEGLEKVAIKQAMTQAEGNVSEAARLLGIGRTKLYKELSKL